MKTPSLREEIGTILVKWNMPTRQAAISEILSAVRERIPKRHISIVDGKEDRYLAGRNQAVTEMEESLR